MVAEHVFKTMLVNKDGEISLVELPACAVTTAVKALRGSPASVDGGVMHFDFVPRWFMDLDADEFTDPVLLYEEQ